MNTSIRLAFNNFISIYQGLSREIWVLSVVSLINRIGAMVIPFLSIYLADAKGFTLAEIGWVMSSFGVGSLIGSWLGGKLTDKFGFYPIIIFSLFTSGIGLILLKELDTFYEICGGFFLVTLFTDILRPPIFVAIRQYSSEKNRTKSITLIRLAINLGFSAGPATGGLLIATWGYTSLFWVDGVSCILALLIFVLAIQPKKKIVEENDDSLEENKKSQSPYRDFPYLLFILSMVFFGVIFMQYFSTVPLFYKEVHELNEAVIGLLLSSNGFVIFLLEMPLIHWVEKQKKYSTMQIMMSSIVLVLLSYILLIVGHDLWVLFIGMMLLTLGEMLMFPLSNAEAMSRASGKYQGDYMALYTIAFSISHLVGHNLGMQSVNIFGYNYTWTFMIAGLLLCIVLLQLFQFSKKREELSQTAK
ncbi:MDR family MFS transporter [Flammeovirga agarivorans]|uniref:MDR family MFS transporter n=1 Tax=Flammeovirga agarivorans TaxID=2726742 RepID=UPI001B3B22E5|nr:MFS transporter [Flammeovirga agarivorans]